MTLLKQILLTNKQQPNLRLTTAQKSKASYKKNKENKILNNNNKIPIDNDRKFNLVIISIGDKHQQQQHQQKRE